LDKNDFRQKCLTKLKHSQKRAYILDKKVQKQLDYVLKSYKPKSVLFYIPLKLEVDLNPLIRKYRKKLDIFVPFIEEKSFKMVKYRMPLKKGQFNIYEPKNSFFKQKDIDMIIVPVVGVDRDFKRVGFGKGMYDRFFEKLKNKPIVVFVQRKKCWTNQKVTDWHDISADIYITPK